MIWTDEAVEELKKMWDKGMTTGQIAKVLNVTKNSIIGKVHRLCLTARPSPIKKSSNSSEKKATTSKKVEKETKAKPASKCKAKEKPIAVEEPKPQTTPIEETNNNTNVDTIENEVNDNNESLETTENNSNQTMQE